jgi:hypothetical protein
LILVRKEKELSKIVERDTSDLVGVNLICLYHGSDTSEFKLLRCSGSPDELTSRGCQRKLNESVNNGETGRVRFLELSVEAETWRGVGSGSHSENKVSDLEFAIVFTKDNGSSNPTSGNSVLFYNV